jgi:uncharacterized protein (DUF4415 family)
MNRGTVKYTKAPSYVERALRHAVPLTPEEEAELLMEPGDAAVNPDPKVKVTILLDKSSVDFFKSQAVKRHTRYQTMINRVLKRYAARYQDS